MDVIAVELTGHHEYTHLVWEGEGWRMKHGASCVSCCAAYVTNGAKIYKLPYLVLDESLVDEKDKQPLQKARETGWQALHITLS